MAGVNKVILVGNLGSDPEIRYLPDGTSMAKVNLATTEMLRRGQGEQRQEHTEWHRLVFFGRQAEVAGEYLHKGSKIYVEGTLRTRKWEAKDGGTRSMVEIRVLQFIMLDSRGGGGGGGRQHRDDSPSSGGSDSQPSGKQKGSGGGDGGTPFDSLEEDDIPF